MSANRRALLDAFSARFGRPATLLAEAPGRVNLIGEHTDYNEGHVLPLAIDWTVVAAVAPADGRVRAHSVDFGADDEFDPAGGKRSERGGWRDYVRGVVWALLEAGVPVAGADLAFGGDVPVGAGLSSSAALEVAVAGALVAVSGVEIESRELALLSRRAESEFVGVRCGVMDQLTAALGRRGQALLIDCRSLEIEYVPLPDDIEIVVVDSAVRRSLGRSAYNERREECARAAAALGVRALRDVPAVVLETKRESLEPLLYRRARHFVTEEVRVIAAAEALRRGELGVVGKLLYGSHDSLRDDFEVSCEELDRLVAAARGVEGVLGARLTGAGFGGCTVNLVRREALDAFGRDVVEAYRESTGLAAEMHVVAASDGLRVNDA